MSAAERGDAFEDCPPHYADCIVWGLPLPGPEDCDCRRDEDGHTRRDDDGSRRVWSEKTLINLDQVPPCEEAS